MQVVFSPDHVRHNPPYEFVDGRMSPYHESPQRAEIISEALVSAGMGPLLPPRTFGLEPVLAVHSPALVAYLEGI